MVSTGPPHSMHLIALKLHQRMDIPWLADFRDPWTDIDFFHHLSLNKRSEQKHRKLEKTVLQAASRVVSIGKTMALGFESIAGRTVDVIQNGYDAFDFSENSSTDTDSFTITHLGSLNRDRNHDFFWESLDRLNRKNEEFSKKLIVKLIGKVDLSVIRSIEKFNLKNYVQQTEYLPHDQIPRVLKSSFLLYLPINRTPNARLIQTGKIFEYLASGRPILGTGPSDGDASRILKETGAGTMIDFDDLPALEDRLQKYFNDFQSGRSGDYAAPEQYSRLHLTGQLAMILDQMV